MHRSIALALAGLVVPTALVLLVLGGILPGAGTHTFWYLTRAAGLGAFVLLTLDVCLGLAIRTRVTDPVIDRWRVTDLHEFTALLGLGLLAVHVLALLGDRSIRFTPAQLLIPFALSYRPIWTGLGIIALYALVGITASFYVRRVIGYRAWRLLHYLTFGAYVLALGHGIFAGTDTRYAWARLLYWASAAAVSVLTLQRIGSSSDRAQDEGEGGTPPGGMRYPRMAVAPVPVRRDGRQPR